MKFKTIAALFLAVLSYSDFSDACVPDVTRQTTYAVREYGRRLVIKVQVHENANIQYTIPKDDKVELTTGKNDGVLVFRDIQKLGESKVVTFDVRANGTQELVYKADGKKDVLSEVEVSIDPQPRSASDKCGWGR